jgi:hypothetical protein
MLPKELHRIALFTGGNCTTATAPGAVTILIARAARTSRADVGR